VTSPSTDASPENDSVIAAASARNRRIVLLGNPNVGKSTLFGRLAGARVHTSNFPGTTQTATHSRVGTTEFIDLPGIYRLEASLDELSSESAVCRAALAGRLPGSDERAQPDAAIVVLDAANLSRNLRLAGEVIRIGLPTVLVVNRIDQAERRGIEVDAEALRDRTGCPVVLSNGLTGEGVERIMLEATGVREPGAPLHDRPLRVWAEETAQSCVRRSGNRADAERLTDRLDDFFLHPILGSIAFMISMTVLFWVVFKIAAYPMDWIDWAFAVLAESVRGVLPPGAIRSLLVDGVIGGIGATVVFLPQICLMFFLITLLEHSGYLPRAALLIDRLLRPFGLPGQAFVPLLSSHACAIPGIIACRGIPDRRERLATILVAPFMSCTARIPVYVLLTSLLFADRPALAAVAFTGCYLLGAATALGTAFLFRTTFLRGSSRTMAMELPGYRRPSLRIALAATRDRAWMFIRKAGTVILAMVLALWWLGSYPIAPPSAAAEDMRLRAQEMSNPAQASALLERADRIDARHATSETFMGMAGRAAAPIFRPLGYDWQLTVGVLSSFAAREVFVSTMAVVTASGEEDAAETETGLKRLATATRDDGQTPLFTRPTSWSLLVFYVLAMQCLPTLAVTARETGGWRWALLQLSYMTALAYLGGMLAFALTGGWA